MRQTVAHRYFRNLVDKFEGYPLEGILVVRWTWIPNVGIVKQTHSLFRNTINSFCFNY